MRQFAFVVATLSRCAMKWLHRNRCGVPAFAFARNASRLMLGQRKISGERGGE